MRAVTSLRRRSGRLVVVVAVAGLLVATVPTVTPGGASAAPATAAASPPRVTGLQLVIGTSASSFAAVKSATATCPAGKQVMGGGAWTWADLSVALTGLEPFRGTVSGRYNYQVTAAAVPPGPPFEWEVHAFAFCADPLPGYEIVPKSSNWSAGDVLTADPVCPTGKRVLGSGALIQFPPEQLRQGVGLQVARADERGVMVRSQGRRAAAGFRPTQWRLTGYAICANPPRGYSVVTERSPEEHSEEAKFADADCPLMRESWHLPLQRGRLLSIGGAASNVAPGNVALWRLAPHWGTDGLSDDSAFASAVENTPTNANWDFIVIRTICVI